MLPQDDIPSTGLGNAVDDYLTAHGYTADACHAIVHTWKQNENQDEFAGYLCGKGMAKSEVQWLWRFINSNHETNSDSESS